MSDKLFLMKKTNRKLLISGFLLACLVLAWIIHGNNSMLSGFYSGMTEEDIASALNEGHIRFRYENKKIQNDFPMAPEFSYYSKFFIEKYCLWGECGSLEFEVDKEGGLWGIGMCKKKPFGHEFIHKSRKSRGWQKYSIYRMRFEVYRDIDSNDYCVGWSDVSL